MTKEALAGILKPATESLRQALREVKAGRVFAIETLWDEIDTEKSIARPLSTQTPSEEVGGT